MAEDETKKSFNLIRHCMILLEKKLQIFQMTLEQGQTNLHCYNQNLN